MLYFSSIYDHTDKTVELFYDTHHAHADIDLYDDTHTVDNMMICVHAIDSYLIYISYMYCRLRLGA